MLPRFRPFLILTALALLSLGAACLTIAGTALRWGWTAPGGQSALEEETAPPERIEAERIDVLRRIAEKQRLAREVVARRLTLAEAAERFGALNREALVRPEFPGPVPPNASEDERLCREVLAYVEDALACRPDEADAVRARLEAEFREHLARRGPAPAGDPGGGRK